MKLAILWLVVLCVVCSGDPDPDPVVDIEGHVVEAGVRYYILPVLRGFGGGLTLSNDMCPRAVIQEGLEVKRGLPLTFTPVNRTKTGGPIPLSTDLNIKFSDAARTGTKCSQSSLVWKLEFEKASGNYVVVSGGVEGNPGVSTVSNWFKIERLDRRDYKLVFCPSVCRFCKVICKDVGISTHQKRRRLSLTDTSPFRVQFKKA